MMNPEEMMEAIRSKNKLLIAQTKRIAMVEEKIVALRKKFFQLKYSNFIKHLKVAHNQEYKYSSKIISVLI